MDNKKGKKVYVGMSGGVDSSVSAALLKQQGFDVTGVFIKVWNPDWMECSWREDRLDAMRVAAKLNIPFITVDFSEQYKREVVDYMIYEYKSGRTPNPDVMCNRYVKFGAFFDWAMREGADFVATGHYARIQTIQNSKLKIENNLESSICNVQLLSGIDASKDQSYFLWTLTKDQLLKTIFPVGGLHKNETRKLANKFDLSTATKKDSQGLCFIGKIDVKEFLSHYIESKKGNVLNNVGEIIGEHKGSMFYTLGERHGFTITKKTPDDSPYFIVAKDVIKNTISVSHKSPDGLLQIEKKEIVLEKTNWITSKIDQVKEYRARIRHLGELLPCALVISNIEQKIIFNTSLIVASGQSIVVYDGDICVGGGIVL